MKPKVSRFCFGVSSWERKHLRSKTWRHDRKCQPWCDVGTGLTRSLNLLVDAKSGRNMNDSKSNPLMKRWGWREQRKTDQCLPWKKQKGHMFEDRHANRPASTGDSSNGVEPVTMPRCTNKWSPPNKAWWDSGTTPAIQKERSWKQHLHHLPRQPTAPKKDSRHRDRTYTCLDLACESGCHRSRLLVLAHSLASLGWLRSQNLSSKTVPKAQRRPCERRKTTSCPPPCLTLCTQKASSQTKGEKTPQRHDHLLSRKEKEGAGRRGNGGKKDTRQKKGGGKPPRIKNGSKGPKRCVGDPALLCYRLVRPLASLGSLRHRSLIQVQKNNIFMEDMKSNIHVVSSFER